MTDDTKAGEQNNKPCLICGKPALMDHRGVVFCSTLSPSNTERHARSENKESWNNAWGHIRIAELEEIHKMDLVKHERLERENKRLQESLDLRDRILNGLKKEVEDLKNGE